MLEPTVQGEFAERLAPYLDATGGRVLKGMNLVDLRDAGNRVEIAARYDEQGAGELSFLEITAASDGRERLLHA